MENLVKKISSITTAWIVLALMVLSLVAIFVFKLNLSPDFSSSRVVIAQLDHEVSTDNVRATADAILKTSQVMKEGTDKFYLVFQNVTDEQILDFTSKYIDAQGGVSSTGDYNFKYAGEVLIFQRILIISAIAFISYAVYAAHSLKGIGFKRIDMIPVIGGELLIFIFSATVLSGVGSLLGAAGLKMDFTYWTMFILAIAVIAAFRIYTIFRFRDIAKREMTTDLSVLYQKLFSKFWPEFVFLFCIAIIICVLPFVVLGTSFLLDAVLVIVACIIAMFNFALLQRDLFRFWNDWDLDLNKKLNKSRWAKKW